MAAGSNDHVIRVYYFDNDNPTKICELESHSVCYIFSFSVVFFYYFRSGVPQVPKNFFSFNSFFDSIQYANHSTRFLSGSEDGTARIWKYERRQWNAMLIDATKSFQKNNDLDDISLDLFKKHSVTMVTWNSDDSCVVTAQNNHLL